MTASEKSAVSAFGFLTVVDQPEWGLVGGYLVLNAGGRPLEFHCTSPVKANRSQEILYGPTLKPYLYGEQIGRTLVTRAKTEALAVFTDQPHVLSLREFRSSPVVLLGDANDATTRLHRSQLGSHAVAWESRYADDEPTLLSLWKQHGETLDLAEPFGRIREALEEAQKSARAA